MTDFVAGAIAGPDLRVTAGLRCHVRSALWDALCMSEQMTLRLDDRLAAGARDAAAAAGSSLSDWVRAAIRHRLALTTALRARAEEDARGGLHSAEQEDALLDARMVETAAAFDRDDPPVPGGR